MAQLNSNYSLFWTDFHAFVGERSLLLKPPRPSSRSFVHIKLDNIRQVDFKLCAATHTIQRWLKSELDVGEEFADAIDELWREHSDEWKAAIGTGLYWHTVGIKGGKLAIRKFGVAPLDPDMRSDNFRWFVETLETFHRTLMPFIRDLV